MLRGTDLIILLDKSGSMNDVQDEVMKGFNKFLAEQRKDTKEGPVAVTLYQFATGFECTYEEKNLMKAPRLNYSNYMPCGQTALYDAVGKAISRSEFRLSRLPDRPGKVLFVVITDGEENASREYNEEMVRKLVEDFKLKWQFVFLGSEQDAFASGTAIGFDRTAIMNYRNVAGSIAGAWKALSESTKRYRQDGREGQFFLPSEQNQ